MTFAAALVATIALPSYAFDPKSAATVSAGGARSDVLGHSQNLAVDEGVQEQHAAADSLSATLPAVLKRQAYAQKFSAYTGPSAADYAKNPAHPSFSLDAVYNTALQYRGVPYVFGGANPSGFDCSGFTMFVYAQYGISLAHSVHMQDAVGTPISPADAQPGDLVIFNDESHEGFYAGDGNILHAPNTGGRVRVQPLWSTAVHFVRLGLK
ncbi:C40 family peptidase [uncultured Amnibacterium sp.]|uniref:C40 family peptidase n=1 Tax=uncultured Amnibacterium sp. TaxID=1631851 RepID=UPI0035CA81C9